MLEFCEVCVVCDYSMLNTPKIFLDHWPFMRSWYMVSFKALVIERVDFSSTPFDQKTLARKGTNIFIKNIRSSEEICPVLPNYYIIVCKANAGKLKNRQEYQRQIIVNWYLVINFTDKGYSINNVCSTVPIQYHI